MVESLQGIIVTENYNSICASVIPGKIIVFPKATFLASLYTLKNYWESQKAFVYVDDEVSVNRLYLPY